MRTARLLAAPSAVLLAAATLTACSPPPDLAGRTFVAVDTTGHTLAEVSRIVLAFRADQVGAQPGCNAMAAPATWEDGVLHLTGEWATTDSSCTDDLLAQDEWFADLLAAEPTLELDDGTLTVSTDDVTVVLEEDA